MIPMIFTFLFNSTFINKNIAKKIKKRYFLQLKYFRRHLYEIGSRFLSLPISSSIPIPCHEAHMSGIIK